MGLVSHCVLWHAYFKSAIFTSSPFSLFWKFCCNWQAEGKTVNWELLVFFTIPRTVGVCVRWEKHSRLPSPLPGYHFHFGSCNKSWWLVLLNSRWWMTRQPWHAIALRPALKESACAPDAGPLLRWLRKWEMKAGIHYVEHTHFPQKETLL